MALVPIWCAWCNEQALKERGAVNRARKAGAYLYCGRACSSAGHRNPNPPTKEQRIAAKSAYDAARREQYRDVILAEKRAYYHRTKEARADQLRAHRQKRMPYHVEYCRKPEYRAKKREYDIQRRAKRQYGGFAEAALALSELEGEVLNRMSRYEIYAANGTLNKVMQRRRADGKAQRSKPEECALGNSSGH